MYDGQTMLRIGISCLLSQRKIGLHYRKKDKLPPTALMPGYFITVAGLQLTQTIFLHSL